MMKKVWKKAMAMTLAGSMVLLAGCGSKTTGQTSGESEQTTAGAAQSGAEGGKANISIMVPQFYGTELKNDHSDEVIKQYEEHTNTQVEWRREANDTYKEKLGLVLMDKDNMPMIVTGSGDLTANVVDAAKKGAFWIPADKVADRVRWEEACDEEGV